VYSGRAGIARQNLFFKLIAADGPNVFTVLFVVCKEINAKVFHCVSVL
jgi:hypothetical protein